MRVTVSPKAEGFGVFDQQRVQVGGGRLISDDALSLNAPDQAIDAVGPERRRGFQAVAEVEGGLHGAETSLTKT